MTIVKFPTKLPPPEQVALARAQFCEQLQTISGLHLARCDQLMQTTNASEFAEVVRAVAEDAAQIGAGWAGVVKIIRDSWGV